MSQQDTVVKQGIICEICNKSFEKIKNLKRHLKLHDSESKVSIIINIKERFKCEKCEKAFSRSDHLKRHVISHSEDKKPFHCDECVMRFSSKDHLKRHVKLIHMEENQYKCEKCDECFVKKYKLNKHISKQHTEKCSSEEDSKQENKTFTCYYPFCPKRYSSQSKLDLHILNHDSERLTNVTENEKIFYQCPIEECFKSYSTMFNLKVHIKTRHLQIEEFSCDKCNMFFKHKCSLERHKNNLHNLEINTYNTNLLTQNI